MFGHNEAFNAKQHDLSTGEVLVREVFPTIQGEGPYTGHPAVFLRLAGCPLRCWFCDTDFDPSKGSRGLVDWVVRRTLHTWLNQWGDPPELAVVTGGEPLAQPAAGPLLRGLAGYFSAVQVETSGVSPLPEDLPGNVDVVVSPKTRGVQSSVAKAARAWKYLIQSGTLVSMTDGLPIDVKTQRDGKPQDLPRPPFPGQEVWLQPVTEYREQGDGSLVIDWEATARNERRAGELALRHGYRVSLQVDGWHYDRLPSLQQRQVEQWVARYGVTVEQLKESFEFRDVVNASAFREMESMGAERFVNQQMGLFDA